MPRQVLEVHTFEHAHFMYHWFLSMTPRPGFITYYLRRFHLNGNHFVTKTARSRRTQRCVHATQTRRYARSQKRLTVRKILYYYQQGGRGRRRLDRGHNAAVRYIITIRT